MAIQKEIWENHIVGNLYKDNQFLQYAFNADQYVLQGKVVHIPNAAAASAVKKNRSTLPATVVRRTDIDITYPLDEFTSDPIHITNADTVELSYDKRQSVLQEDQSKLAENIAENMIANWAPGSSNFVPTTGGNTAATAPSATGTRKIILLEDIKSAMKKMNKASVPQTNRYALFSAEMYQQVLDQLDVNSARDFSSYFDAATGVVGRLYGFNFLLRATGLVYSSTNVALDTESTPAAGDNEAVLCWHQDSVERALGTVSMFENLGDPTYYGDIYSFLVRMGGRIRRNDNKGVYAIVQAAGV